MQRWLVGIDDTDNHESRGTGFLAREMGRFMTEAGIGRMLGITRHQLLFDERIPYTSHNSSACMEVVSGKKEELHKFCIDFLVNKSAEGSDAGLCIIPFDNVSENVVQWGLRAKKEILTMEESLKIAEKENIFLEGYTGTKCGIIGSLAAVGLRKCGNDGRFLWIRGMREMTGVFSISEVKKSTGIEKILTVRNQPPAEKNKVFLGEWWRPVMKNNKIVMFVEPCLHSAGQKNENNYEWQVVSKDYIKSISG